MNITKNILNDYKLYNANITEKIEILRKNIFDYNQTIISFLNSSVEQKLTNLSVDLYIEQTIDNLNELMQSFKTIEQNKTYFYQDIEELQYIANTVDTLRNGIDGELKDIQDYTKKYIKK